MKAVRIHQFGGPEVLTYEDIPAPQPRKDQVLVRVRACSLNHLDIWVRKGLPGVKLPHILGSDIAGEIVEVGEYVGGFKAGQRVLLAPMHFCGYCEKCVSGVQNQCREFTVLGNGVDGGNCEMVAAPAANVIAIPDSLDFNHAASVPLVFLTAWHMLVGRAAIRPRTDGAGAGSKFRRRDCRDSNCQTLSLSRNHHCGRRRRSWPRGANSARTSASTTISRRFPRKCARSRIKKALTSWSSM